MAGSDGEAHGDPSPPVDQAFQLLELSIVPIPVVAIPLPFARTLYSAGTASLELAA